VNKTTFLFLSFLFFFIGFSTVFLSQNKIPKCANSISCVKNLETEVNNNAEAVFLGQVIPIPQIDLASEYLTQDNQNDSQVLGDESGDESNLDNKHIYIDLSKQTLYAYEGNNIHLQTLTTKLDKTTLTAKLAQQSNGFTGAISINSSLKKVFN